jgi:hypothetical protein
MREAVQENVEEFYLTVDKLSSYRTLNLSAIHKILKKYVTTAIYF